MTGPGFGLLAALVAQQPQATDSLYQLALRLPESSLALEARTRPLAVREALADAFRLVVANPAGGEALRAARHLAGAYAVAWQDPFLSRQVERFAALSHPQRAAKTRSDSLRRAGVAAFSQRGPRAAILVWQRALRGYRAIADSAGMGATLDNIGAGLTRLGRLDSAAVYLSRGQRLAAAAGDLRVQANALGHLGDLSAERGDLATARERYSAARALRERIGDSRGVAADENNLGLLARDLGDLAAARSHFEAALALNRAEQRPEVAATNLLNLAGLASLEGNFADAEACYRSALSTWRERAEWAEAASALYGLGQLELRRGDYPAARAALREALTLFQRTGSPSDAVLAERALADALAALGDPQGALDRLEAAQRYSDSAGAGIAARAALTLAQADLLLRLNAIDRAELRYREASRLSERAGDQVGKAEALHGLGLLFLAREDPARAQEPLLAAQRVQRGSGQRRAEAVTNLSLSRVFALRGDTAAARRQLAQAAAELERLGDVVATAEALGERAALEAAAGAPALAESFYRSGLRRLENRTAPETSGRLRAGLALTLRSRGALDAAARELRAALITLEGPGQTLALPERRSGYLTDKREYYARLAVLETERGFPEAAFEASERLRSRELLDMLARGRIAAAPGDAAELVGQEQDLRRRMGELSRSLELRSLTPESLRGPDPSRLNAPARQELLKAQEEYGDLLLRLRERAPRHETAVTAPTAPWREVARRLAADQAFLTYLLSDSASVAFVITRDTLRIVRLGVTRTELARLVEFSRGALDGRRSDSLWRAPLQRLNGYLMAPIEEAGLLAGKSRLIVALHAELNYLPFGALLSREGRPRFLSERYELTLTPSASVWVALGQRHTGPAGTGVLALAPSPEALPGSRREVAAIARALGAVETRLGGAASEEAFRREAPTRRIIHLATYGLLNKQNPLFSFVELASGQGEDGRLEVHEVFGLRLQAELVVLSACQTGLGSGALADVPAGDDWVGLTRAFLLAGARRVVASLWPVDDWATAALMERFYQALARGNNAARALAEAQQALRAEAATANPFYWAGFVVVGGAESGSTGVGGEGK